MRSPCSLVRLALRRREAETRRTGCNSTLQGSSASKVSRVWWERGVRNRPGETVNSRLDSSSLSPMTSAVSSAMIVSFATAMFVLSALPGPRACAAAFFKAAVGGSAQSASSSIRVRFGARALGRVELDESIRGVVSVCCSMCPRSLDFETESSPLRDDNNPDRSSLLLRSTDPDVVVVSVVVVRSVPLPKSPYLVAVGGGSGCGVGSS